MLRCIEKASHCGRKGTDYRACLEPSNAFQVSALASNAPMDKLSHGQGASIVLAASSQHPCKHQYRGLLKPGSP